MTTPVRTQTAYEIVRESFLVLGVIDADRPMQPELRESGFNALSNLVKTLQTTYHLWADTEAILFLSTNQTQYSFGPNGDHVTDISDLRSYTTNSSSSGTTVNVTGSIATNDYIGVFLNDGSIFWSTVDSYAAGVATIAGSLPSTVNTGNTVHVYTNKIPRPLKVVNSRAKSTISSRGFPTSKWNSTQYFESNYDIATGVPTAWFYDPQLTNGLYHVNKKPTSDSNVIRFTYVRPLEVTSLNGDLVDFPSEWFLPLTYLLAQSMIPQFPSPDQLTMEIKEQASFYSELMGLPPLGKLKPIPEAGRSS